MARSAPTPVFASDVDRRWIKRPRRHNSTAAVTLLCFHHAGGSASTFRTWPGLIDPAVELIAVQLPGRADRFNETPFDDFSLLAEAAVEAITPLLDRPFAFYGVSMGARLAWTVTLKLREQSLPMPVRLFLACEPAPVHDNGSQPWQSWPGGLAGYMRDLGGTPPEVLAEPDLLRALLPTLQADLIALTTAPGRPATPLEVPVHSFAGTTDSVASPARMAAWAAETSSGFELDSIPGGHFFDPDGERRVVRAIGDDLRRRGEEDLE